MCYRAAYTPSTWYLFDTYPSQRGVWSIVAAYYLLFALHASDTLPIPNPSHRGGGGVNNI